MKLIIENILDELSFRLPHKGYAYWTEAALLKLENPFQKIGYLYIAIANKHNVSSMSVERAMRYQVSRNKQTIKDFFKIKYRLNNNDLLYLIVREAEKRNGTN